MIPKEILRQIHRIEINTRRLVEEVFAGQYESAFKGQGIEFAEVREYQPGDDIRSIDWNVTARTGKPFVKQYTEERELTVMLLVDMSGSQYFGSTHKTKSEIAAEVAALLAFSAIKNNDRAGLISFTSDIEKFIPPKKGQTHILRMVREILYFKPKKRGTDIGKALKYLIEVCKKKSIAFLISDFIGEDYEVFLRGAYKTHDLVALVVGDPSEEDIPPLGIFNLEDPESGECIRVDGRDSRLREFFLEKVKKAKQYREKLFKSINLDYINLTTTESYIEPLLVFFRNRTRRFR
mgnify:CR=1 FL=1